MVSDWIRCGVVLSRLAQNPGRQLGQTPDDSDASEAALVEQLELTCGEARNEPTDVTRQPGQSPEI
jgi:hypothetical protein